MAKLKKGDAIGIHCTVAEGPFDDELFVKFDSLEGPVSGFAKKKNVRPAPNGDWLLRGIVVSSDEKTITAKVEGSFFTTNGLADFSADAPFEKLAA